MKILFYSDLHNEFAPFEPSDTEADVVVLAGDIHYKRQSVLWAADAFNKPVVMIAGNHEHYQRSELHHNLKRMREQAAETEHLHFLEKDRVVIDGVRFLGCTLWSDLGLGDQDLHPGETHHLEYHVNDYNSIRISPKFRRMRAQDVLAMHRDSVAWLKESLAEQFDGHTVVVTHHAPSLHSFGVGEKSIQLQGNYCSPLDDLVAASGAALWIHGHLHHSSDYWIGKTRVVCNPRGYAPHHLNSGFDQEAVIDLDSLAAA